MAYFFHVFEKSSEVVLSYFNHERVKLIADIGANHDGSLSKAKDLIYLAAQSGADVAKFQNFRAETIVSHLGFKRLGASGTHQDTWDKTVFEVYESASMPIEWVPELRACCDDAGIEFMTSVYDPDMLDDINEYVTAYKIGSGDLTWHDMLRRTAHFGKPIIVATGASSLDHVDAAVEIFCKSRIADVCVMQCNTNYTGDDRTNASCLNLNVIDAYRKRYPQVILGLSDHTRSGHAVAIAVGKGCKVIERHFTSDTQLKGPDHSFACNPADFLAMREIADECLRIMGSGIKVIEDNELRSAIVQRRCLRAARDLPAGYIVQRDDIVALRPCDNGDLLPTDENLALVEGKALARAIGKHEPFEYAQFRESNAP